MNNTHNSLISTMLQGGGSISRGQVVYALKNFCRLKWHSELNGLPPRARQVVAYVLCDQYGFQQSQLATLFGVHRSQVCRDLSNARFFISRQRLFALDAQKLNIYILQYHKRR